MLLTVGAMKFGTLVVGVAQCVLSAGGNNNNGDSWDGGGQWPSMSSIKLECLDLSH